jgi:hypothetical protein
MRDEPGNSGPIGFAVPRELSYITTGNLLASDAYGASLTNTTQAAACTMTINFAALVNMSFMFIAGTTYAGLYKFTATNSNTITLDGVEGSANGSVSVTSVNRGDAIFFRSYPTTAGVYHWYAITISGPWAAS